MAEPAPFHRIGFIGLGIMGAPMATNLIKKGFDVAVFDVNEVAIEAFDRLACHRADSVADAARDADVVILMLPTSLHVHDALLGEGAAAKALNPGGLVIDMSTGGLTELLLLHEALNALGLRLVDAPVARGRQEAIDGTLIVLAGGDAADVEAARPLFAAMASHIMPMGPLGSGIKAKLVNNYGAMINMVVAAELLTFGAKLGLDRPRLVSVLIQTAAGKGQLAGNYAKKVLAGDITPDFPLRMGLKDLRLAETLAADIGMPVWLGAAARQLFALSARFGRENDDCTAMLLLLEELAGVRGPPAYPNETS